MAFYVQNKHSTYLKSTPMTKKEVHLLLDLVASKPILTSKNTKSTVNKLKRRAWAEIEVEFNAKNDQPRPRDQLSLRWSNLKKTCRKKVKISGGKLVPAKNDEITERVLSLLEGTRRGLEMLDTVASEDVSDSGSYSIDDNDTNMTADNRYTTELDVNKIKATLTTEDIERHRGNSQGSKYKDDGIRERNLSLAEYFEKKAQKIDIEIKLLKLQLLSDKQKLIGEGVASSFGQLNK